MSKDERTKKTEKAILETEKKVNGYNPLAEMTTKHQPVKDLKSMYSYAYFSL